MVTNGGDQSGHRILKLTVFQNELMEWTGFLHMMQIQER